LKKLQQLVSSICALESMEAEVATRSSAAVAAHSSAAVAAGTSFAALCGDRMAELAPSDDEEVVTPPKKGTPAPRTAETDSGQPGSVFDGALAGVVGRLQQGGRRASPAVGLERR